MSSSGARVNVTLGSLSTCPAGMRPARDATLGAPMIRPLDGTSLARRPLVFYRLIVSFLASFPRSGWPALQTTPPPETTTNVRNVEERRTSSAVIDLSS